MEGLAAHGAARRELFEATDGEVTPHSKSTAAEDSSSVTSPAALDSEQCSDLLFLVRAVLIGHGVERGQAWEPSPSPGRSFTAKSGLSR